MKVLLSLVIITKNAHKTLGRALGSVKNIVDEIVLIDDGSTDNTLSIAKAYGAKIYKHHEYDLGRQRLYGYNKATGEWLLILDADEYVSPELNREIKKLKSDNFNSKYRGFWVRFQTHFLGKPLHYGGETYSKMILFNKQATSINPSLVHEKYEVINGQTSKLKNVVYHYSYESIFTMFKKFTDYSVRAARQKKSQGEKSSLRKIFSYPIHMFWSRFVIDKGYKDGFFRVPLDIGFAYMEFLTYVLIPFI